MAHAIVKTELMQGTYDPTALVSLKYYGENEANQEVLANIDNGNVVLLGDLMTGEREIFKATTPAANSDIKNIVLVAAPERFTDERKRNMKDFYNVAGDTVRGYRLVSGRWFSVTSEAISGTLAKGKIVELQAGTQLKAVTSPTGGSTVVGKIMEVEEVGLDTFYAIKIN